MNNHFVAIIDGHFEFTKQHSLEATGELELEQSALQKERQVVVAVSALGRGQHYQSVGGSGSSTQDYVHCENLLQR